MGKARTVPQHEIDLLSLESITSVPAGLIDGFVIILSTTGGDSRVITNACCVYHAMHTVTHLAREHLEGVVPCNNDST